MHVRSVRAGLVTLAAAVSLPLSALPASAATVSDLATGLAGPLQIAVGSTGSVYVGENFAGTLTEIDKNGRKTTVTSVPAGAEVAGVDALGRGTVVYTTSSGASEESSATSGALMQVLPNGRTSQLADLYAFEQQHNPDKINTYGLVGLSDSCTAELADAPPFVLPYPGILETHPYAVAIVPGGWVVADAAGNDLVQVRPNGSVRALAVLPPQPFTVTADFAADAGLPECVAGATYNAEPVPTDVELGPDGYLYVTTLPGGPTSGGPTGSVYRVNPSTGAVSLVATGFSGATNLAVAPNGTIYVAELMGGRVSRVSAGGPVTVVELPFPGAVEWANGRLYVGYGVFGNGTVATITP